MKSKFTQLIAMILFLVQNVTFGQAPTLGTTSSFALFTATGALTNDGASMVTGDVGTNTGAFTGFPPGVLVGLPHVIDGVSATAAEDVLVAYNFLAGLTPLDVIGVGLGGPGEVVLGPGVHSIGAAATLNGTLTLDGGGDPNALFIFQINGALGTAANSRVELINLANPCNVYWRINGQFDLATGSVFVGTVIAEGPINLFVGSSLFGRGLATAGAINVHTALVTVPVCGCSIPAPTAGAITQPDCYTVTGSVVLGGLPAGNWTINPGTIAGTGTSRTLSGLAAGTYNFTVTDAAGCISAPSGNVVINTFTFSQPLTAPTVVSIMQPTCEIPTGSVVLGGLPAETWTINPGGITGTGTTTTIYNLAVGTHNFTVTNADVCWNYSAPSENISINAIVTTPTVTLTQPTNCTSHTGTITVSGLTGDCFKYSIDGSDYTNTSGIFTSVPAGTYTVTAINPDGCISSGTRVTINSLPAYTAPTVGTVTQPNCAVGTGSVILNGLPPTGNWFINPGGIAGTGTTKTIYGLVAGTYNFTVTSPEVCWSYSPPSADVVINDAIVAAPTVTLTQPTTCTTPTGTITITAPSGTGMTYSIDGSTYTNTTGIFTPVPAGSYLVTAKNADGCISSGTSVMINAQPVTLASATAQPTCTVITGTITVTAPAGTAMTYSIDGSNYTNTTGTFTLVPMGTYTVTSKSSDGCISIGTRVTIIPPGPLAGPTVTVTQPTTCVSPNGTINVTAPTGGGMTYSINGSTYTNTTGIFTSVSAGTYTVTAKSADGCISLGTTVTINTQPVTLATATAQPTCTAAKGTITVTEPAGATYSINGSDYTNTTGIFELPSGTYPVTSKVGECISSVISVTINAQPASPAAPAVTVTQPTGTETTGSISVTAPGYCMEYSINGSPYTYTTIYTDLPTGPYTIYAKDWYGGCISSGTLVNISGATAIEKIGGETDFEVYPVPNDGHFIAVITSQSEKHFDILISNTQGSKIYEEKNIIVKGKLEHRIDLTRAREGVYYIMLRSDIDKVIRKIVVLR
jgi:hypothetical protein